MISVPSSGLLDARDRLGGNPVGLPVAPVAAFQVGEPISTVVNPNGTITYTYRLQSGATYDVTVGNAIKNIEESFPDAFDNTRKKTGRPRKTPKGGGTGGGSGGGGAGGGPVPIPFGPGQNPLDPSGAATGAERAAAVLRLEAAGTPGVFDESGQLSGYYRAALVDGLNLDEFTAAIVGFLAPEDVVGFDVFTDAAGVEYLGAARLLTGAPYRAEKRPT